MRMGSVTHVPGIFYFTLKKIVLFSAHQVLPPLFLKTMCYFLLRPIFPSHSLKLGLILPYLL